MGVVGRQSLLLLILGEEARHLQLKAMRFQSLPIADFVQKVGQVAQEQSHIGVGHTQAFSIDSYACSNRGRAAPNSPSPEAPSVDSLISGLTRRKRLQ